MSLFKMNNAETGDEGEGEGETPEAPVEARKPRTLGAVRVAEYVSALVASASVSVQTPEPMLRLVEVGFEDTTAATRWIRDHGKPGAEYAVLRLVSTHRVQEATVTRRTLIAR